LNHTRPRYASARPTCAATNFYQTAARLATGLPFQNASS